jgi:hypothetical protein
MAFWIWILIGVLVIGGLSVLVGKAISKSDRERLPPSRQQQMTALKASGALRHRKSNRP